MVIDLNAILWQHSSHAGYNRRLSGADLPWLTLEQNCMRERIRHARLLFRGMHRQYFLDEGRTQFDFPMVRAGSQTVQLYITFNLLRLVSKKTTDLLLGEEPIIRLDEAANQTGLSDFIDATSLYQRLYAACIEASWAAHAAMEVLRWTDGEVYVQNLKPDEIMPEGPMLPDGSYRSYVRHATANIGTEEKPRHLLLETRHLPGRIERKLYSLGSDGMIAGDAPLSDWPVKGLREIDELPFDDTNIVWMPNEIEEGECISDYDGLVELQDELNAKQTQIARVLAKHSDPKLAAPRTAADEKGNLPTNHDVYFFNTKDEIPAYITWNAELAAAVEDRKFTLNAMCIVAEMSPVLLGLKEGAAPDAARKLRLEATNSLARAKRKSVYLKPAVKRIAWLAQSLRGVNVGVGSIGVDVRDGLPVDGMDQANEISTLRSAGVLSRARAVEMQLPDPAARDREIDELTEEAASAMPTVLMSEPDEVMPPEASREDE